MLSSKTGKSKSFYVPVLILFIFNQDNLMIIASFNTTTVCIASEGKSEARYIYGMQYKMWLCT